MNDEMLNTLRAEKAQVDEAQRRLVFELASDETRAKPRAEVIPLEQQELRLCERSANLGRAIDALLAVDADKAAAGT